MFPATHPHPHLALLTSAWPLLCLPPSCCRCPGLGGLPFILGSILSPLGGHEPQALPSITQVASLWSHFISLLLLQLQVLPPPCSLLCRCVFMCGEGKPSSPSLGFSTGAEPPTPPPGQAGRWVVCALPGPRSCGDSESHQEFRPTRSPQDRGRESSSWQPLELRGEGLHLPSSKFIFTRGLLGLKSMDS